MIFPHRDLSTAISTATRSQAVDSCSFGPRSAEPLFQPPLKGRFKVVERLGRGGFGTTYLANEITASYSQPCVIKRLRYRLKRDQTAAQRALDLERNLRRFQRETRTLARIGRHDQLPRLLDHFIDNSQFYIVQAHIPGLTLQQEIHQNGPQCESEVKTFLRSMIPVLRHVHRHNLLHLDIKPANIIRRNTDQKPVLIDFGSVREYDPNRLFANSSAKLEPSQGTIGFSPSEQLAGSPLPASDIYSLGVTCLHLLTGYNPVDFATSPTGQDLHWQDVVQVSAHFAQILRKMLAANATHRFQSIDDLERAMNLETEYKDLKVCMTHEPLSPSTLDGLAPKGSDLNDLTHSSAACQIETYAEHSGRSHAERQAKAIRRWQQHRQHF